jgi:hypothetical protein
MVTRRRRRTVASDVFETLPDGTYRHQSPLYSEGDTMRYENLGPVRNPDGSPTDLTRSMLEGTGRDPVEFARQVPAKRAIPTPEEYAAGDADGELAGNCPVCGSFEPEAIHAVKGNEVVRS